METFKVKISENTGIDSILFDFEPIEEKPIGYCGQYVLESKEALTKELIENKIKDVGLGIIIRNCIVSKTAENSNFVYLIDYEIC
jgi:hypothetical protein